MFMLDTTMDEKILRQRLHNLDRMLLPTFEDPTNFNMLLSFTRYWEDTYQAVVDPSSNYSNSLQTLAHEVALRVGLITRCFQNLVEFAEETGDVIRRETVALIGDGRSTHRPRASNGGGDVDVQTLRTWFLDHIDNPYPDKDVVTCLASQCDVTLNSVKYFFTNTRRRLHWKDFLINFAGGSKPRLSTLIAAIDAGATSYRPTEDGGSIAIPSEAAEALEAMRLRLKEREVDDLLHAIAAEKTQIEADRGFLVAQEVLEPGKPLPQLRSTKGGSWSKRMISGAPAVRSSPTASSIPESPPSCIVEPPRVQGTSLGPALSLTGVRQPSSASSSITVTPSVTAYEALSPPPGIDNDFLQELFSTGINFDVDELLFSLQQQQVEESVGKKRRRTDDDVGEAEGALVKRRRGALGEGPSAASGVAGHPVRTLAVQHVEHDEVQFAPEHPLEGGGLGLSAVAEDAALLDVRNLFSGDVAFDSIWNAQDFPSAFHSAAEGSQIFSLDGQPFRNPPASVNSEASRGLNALGPFGQGLDSDTMTVQELEDLLNILNSTNEHAISLDDNIPHMQYQGPGTDAAAGALRPTLHPSTMTISNGDDTPASLDANEMQSFEAWAAAIIATPVALGLHPDDQDAADNTGQAGSLQTAHSGSSSLDVDLVQPAQTPDRDRSPATSDRTDTFSPCLGALPDCQFPSSSSSNTAGDAKGTHTTGAVILGASHAYQTRCAGGETSTSVRAPRTPSSNVAPPTWTLKPAVSYLPKPRRRSAKHK